MAEYVSRLWAALCGRDFVSLSIGASIPVRAPGGPLLHLKIASVTLSRNLVGPDRLQIDAVSASAWMVRDG